MRIMYRLAKLFSPPKEVEEEELQQEVQQVHGQYCNGELTENGGDISRSGKIYCNEKYKLKEVQCSLLAYITGHEDYDYRILAYHDGNQIQEDIQKGYLTEFGKLEEKIEGTIKSESGNVKL